ncbi:MAG: carbon storage regulator [Phycisphaerae bacterium]
MLVLLVRHNEKVMIGDNINITVVEVRKGAVRLGINAPRTVTVLRESLYNEAQKPEYGGGEPGPLDTGDSGGDSVE